MSSFNYNYKFNSHQDQNQKLMSLIFTNYDTSSKEACIRSLSTISELLSSASPYYNGPNDTPLVRPVTSKLIDLGTKKFDQVFDICQVFMK